MRRRIATLTAALAVSSVAFAPAPATFLGDVDAGTLLDAATPVDVAPVGTWQDRTIVVLDESVTDVAATAHRLLAPHDIAPVHLYEHALRGFSVVAPAAVVEELAADPQVAFVEADREVRTAAQSLPRGVVRIDADHAAAIGAGAQIDVDIAIIDTGIASHSDLRVQMRLDCTDDAFEPTVEYVEWLLYGSCKTGGSDNDGHGTHVAGIAGARDNSSDVVGVAPGARLWAVKVLESSTNGSLSDVINGVDEVTRRADTIEVANISLVASGRSDAMDAAVSGATDEGVVVVVAAGNAAENASNTTPANSPDAITVSAVTDLDGLPGGRRSGSCHGSDDRFATYSNFGAVVDIAAPGSCIVSTRRGGGVESRSGTSMATPHVAGAAALRISKAGFSRSASRAQRVLDDLLSTSAAEGSACGYTGSPSNERLLELVKGC